MSVSSCSASCSIPKKRASSSTPREETTNVRTVCEVGFPTHTFQGIFVFTQRVDAVVDDQLPMSQIIQNGFKVIRTPVDQISPMSVLLVPPNI